MRHWRSWRNLVILLAVLSICVHVSTRTFHSISLNHPGVQAYPPHAKHQNLNLDAFELIHPVSPLAMLLPVAAPHAPPEKPHFRAVAFSDCLYNRPPPAFSLL